MEILKEVLVSLTDSFFGFVNMFSAFATNWENFLSTFLLTGGIVAFAFAATGITYANIPAEVLTSTRRWHGTIDERFSNIENLVVLIQSHLSTWGTPPQFSQLVSNRTQLATLISKCRSPLGASVDRGQRNFLMKTTIALCIGQIKVWAYMQYYANIMTINDVHTLGFLLPGEAGGHHKRLEATDVQAEVKVSIINADFIHVVIDQAVGENAALTAHGWPPKVRKAVIVITSVDGKTEILRRFTTRLHNDICMPDGSHGKQFIIKASFLRHIDDEPRFGPQPTFTMPYSTEDLSVSINRQYHSEFEEKLREIEDLRNELNQLKSLVGNHSAKE
jgi:hypothetical protein